MTCRICGNGERNRLFSVREMMFGSREVFPYVLCGSCGCLQIQEVPSDLARHYPATYYSQQPVGESPRSLRRALMAVRDRQALFGGAGLGAGLSAAFPNHEFNLLRRCGVSLDSRILDVGCGAGHLLVSLAPFGFRRLRGVDPYNREDLRYANGVTVLKRTLLEVEGEWDVVMFHHSFEHIAEQRDTLRQAAALLSDRGVCLVRVPVVSCDAWERYGVNWVDLDAPRHLYLHSYRSLELLAQAAGLTVVQTVCDSTAFQFWGSEQYARDIPLFDERSLARGCARSIFSRAQRRAFARQAAELNRLQRGDQAAFFLQRAPG